MSLHGSLETFALTDVLALLSSTHKTGELRIVGDRSQGSIWVDAGRLVQSEVPRASTPVDAIFELLRLPDGMFTFEQGHEAPDPRDPLPLEGLVTQAEQRLEEWRAIEAVVPSAAVAVRLQHTVDTEVRLSPDQWRMLVAAVDGGTVSSVCERLELGEFDACRGVRDLVQLGVVHIEEAPVAAPAPAAERPKNSAAGATVTVSATDAEAEAHADASDAADASDDVDDDVDPLAALAAVAVAKAGVEPGDDGEGDGDRDEMDEDAPVAASGADGDAAGADELDVSLPGQPLPAWALADDDDTVGGEGGESGRDLDEAKGPAAEPRLRAMATAVDDEDLDPEALEEAELDGEALEAVEGLEPGVGGELGDEPINRGLLLKFLSSVRS